MSKDQIPYATLWPPLAPTTCADPVLLVLTAPVLTAILLPFRRTAVNMGASMNTCSLAIR